MFHFDTSNADGSGCIEEFCKDYNDEHEDDNFEITRDYLVGLDQKNIKYNFMLTLTNIQCNVIGYHIIASVLGLPNDLDINFTHKLKELVEEENKKLDRCGSEHVAYIKRFEKIGNRPFVYKKSILNVLKRTDIGKNLHPLFSDLRLSDPIYINVVLTAAYKTLTKSTWIQNMGMGYGVCIRLSFFYIKDT